ncbi:MAG: hypothetical protein Q7K65_03795 [Candidatus Buchananbacteria bacterium]|nr:hypothetical protein [Candidatus Buchananbacteria bacterium]
MAEFKTPIDQSFADDDLFDPSPGESAESSNTDELTEAEIIPADQEAEIASEGAGESEPAEPIKSERSVSENLAETERLLSELEAQDADSESGSEVPESVPVPLEEIDRLLKEYQEFGKKILADAEQAAAGVPAVVEQMEAVVNEQLSDLSEAEALQVQTETEEARNDLLGNTSDALDTFESRKDEIIAENRARTEKLREHFETKKVEPLAGIAKLAEAEERLKSEVEQKKAEDLKKADETIANFRERNKDRLKDKIEPDTIVKPEQKLEPNPFQEVEPPVESATPVATPDINKEPESPFPEAKESPIESADTPIANPEIKPIVPETPFVEMNSDTVVTAAGENGQPVEIHLRSERNVGVFERLGMEAKQVFVDLTFKTLGKMEIKNGQSLLERSKDKVYSLDQDLAKSDGKIDQLKDKLDYIDKMTSRTREDLKPKELKAIEKSRQDLETKIINEQKSKEAIAFKLEDEKANQAKLQAGLEKIMAKLDKAIEERIEPYKQEKNRLEKYYDNLVEEQNNFLDVIEDFRKRSSDFRYQVASLDETDLPRKVKKSFQAVLNKKIKGIESTLKIAEDNFSKLEDNIIEANGRLNKEEIKIAKKMAVRDSLKEMAQPQPEKERAEISSGYIPKSREAVESSAETPKFSAEDYIDKWNSISLSDGLLLDKAKILSSGGELSQRQLESRIKTSRFKGLSARQLKKKIKEKTDLVRAYFGQY